LTVRADEVPPPSSRKHQLPGYSPPAAPGRGLSLAAIAVRW